MVRLPALLLALALAFASACGTTPAPTDTTASERSFDLPFGLREIDGTTAVGRPATYDDVLYEFKGQPVRGTRLQAAYRVTASEPVEVFQQWLNQLAELPLTTLDAGPGNTRAGQWLTATGYAYRPDKPSGASAQMQLWSTEAGPVLLVDISVLPGAEPDQPTIPTVPRTPRPTKDIDSEKAGPGDVLFVEQDQPVQLPDGARGLLGTIPTPAGTGGSFSVLAAADGGDVVRALLDEATSYGGGPDIRGPDQTVQNGLRVTRATFNKAAGGWGFDVVSVQAEDDTDATVYVTSSAD